MKDRLKLVLLPGLDGTGKLFDRFIDSLPELIEPIVIAYPVDRELGYRELFRYVEERLPTNEVFAMVAESFSTPIALHVAENRQNLLALILCAPVVTNPTPMPENWIGRLLVSIVMRLPFPKIAVRHFLLGADCPEDLLDEFMQALKLVDRGVLIHRLLEVLKVDATNQAAKCDKPLLVLTPKNDRLVSAKQSRKIAESNKSVEFVALTGPHLLLQRSARECAEICLDFLKVNNI